MTTMRIIDWRAHEEIQKDIKHLNEIKNDPNSPFGMTGPMPVEMGQKLKLSVHVTDPELAQIVLGRSYTSDEGTRIPGMAIDEICIDPNGQQRTTLADQLRELADRLEHNELGDFLK